MSHLLCHASIAERQKENKPAREQSPTEPSCVKFGSLLSVLSFCHRCVTLDAAGHNTHRPPPPPSDPSNLRTLWILNVFWSFCPWNITCQSWGNAQRHSTTRSGASRFSPRSSVSKARSVSTRCDTRCCSFDSRVSVWRLGLNSLTSLTPLLRCVGVSRIDSGRRAHSRRRIDGSVLLPVSCWDTSLEQEQCRERVTVTALERWSWWHVGLYWHCAVVESWCDDVTTKIKKQQQPKLWLQTFSICAFIYYSIYLTRILRNANSRISSPIVESSRSDSCKVVIVLVGGRWVATVPLLFCPSKPELVGEDFSTQVSRYLSRIASFIKIPCLFFFFFLIT